jgi:DNA polymerase elongation subunit (family B)
MGDFIYERNIEDGVRNIEKLRYRPTVYVDSSDSTSEYHTLYGDPVDRIDLDSITTARNYAKQYSGSNVNIYEHDIGWQYQHIVRTYPGVVDYDSKSISVFYIDIETEVDVGFPHPNLAEQRINVITIYDSLTKMTHCWSLNTIDQTEVRRRILSDGGVKLSQESLKIYDTFEDDEYDMLSSFLGFWRANYPDVITGWNIESFDIPYIVNRVSMLFGESTVKGMSPFNKLRTKTISIFGKDEEIFLFEGISTLDYLPLYKKIVNKNHESFKLDFIAEYYLGRGKLEYDGSFKEFYTKEYDKFVAYNIVDVHLVFELDGVLSLFDTTFGVSYLAKTNFEDIFSPVKIWDIMIYDYMSANKIVPPNKKHNTGENFEGAFVREPRLGFLKWLLSFDVNSMYPHIIIGWNMSPERIQDESLPVTVDSILNKSFDFDSIPENMALTANGALFDNREIGILPKLTKVLYDGRSNDKNEASKAKKDAKILKDRWEELTKSEIEEYNRLISLSTRKNVEQNAKKVLLNSLFGASGNEHFRYFDIRIAEGITMTGQMIIRWAGNELDTYFKKLTGSDVVVYQDTDSIYITLEKFVEKLVSNKTDEQIVDFLDKVAKTKIEPFLAEVFTMISKAMGCAENHIHMKREAIAYAGAWTAKKRYMLSLADMEGYRYKTPELKMTGMDAIKSSTPAIARKHIAETFRLIMTGDQDKVEEYIDFVRTEFEKSNMKELAFPRGVNNLEKYEDSSTIYSRDGAVPIHVRATLLYNFYLKKYNVDPNRYPQVTSGSKIKYCYLKTPNPIRENVIAFESDLPEEFGLRKYVNIEVQYEKSYMSSIESILDAIGWGHLLETTGSIF